MRGCIKYIIFHNQDHARFFSPLQSVSFAQILSSWIHAQCSKTALPPTKSPRLATVCAKKLKFGLKTPCATLIKEFRSNLGSFPVWTRNGPNSCLISRKIVQIWSIRARKLKFGLKTPYALFIRGTSKFRSTSGLDWKWTKILSEFAQNRPNLNL